MIPVYAYFLPQFYSIPENDKYWGEGFTEWTNVRNSEPRFKGHQNPILPVNEDYYDLSEPETVERILTKSRDIGIDAVAYWYYWFGDGKRALTKVPRQHLKNKQIEQNFFFAWANNNWSKEWIGDRSQIIFEQKYNLHEIDDHLDSLIKYFEDDRYVKWHGQPLLQLNEAHKSQGYEYIFELNNRFVQRTGTSIKWIFPSVFVQEELRSLPHFISGYPTEDVLKVDWISTWRRKLARWGLANKPVLIEKDHFLKMFRKVLKKNKHKEDYIPCILSGWDNTYRYKEKGYVISGSIEELVREQMSIIKEEIDTKELPFILVKAYNEWAEGNILENYTINGKEHDISHLVKDVIKNGEV